MKTNTISPVPQKTQKALEMTRHQMKITVATPSHMEALAGTLMDLNKSNVRIQGLPQKLMRCAAQGVKMNTRKQHTWDKRKAWNTSIKKEECNTAIIHLKTLLDAIQESLQKPVPRTLRRKREKELTLQTDASNKAWGATLLLGGKEICTSDQRWTPLQTQLHISPKEALATALAIKNM